MHDIHVGDEVIVAHGHRAINPNWYGSEGVVTAIDVTSITVRWYNGHGYEVYTKRLGAATHWKDGTARAIVRNDTKSLVYEPDESIYNDLV